MALCPQRGFVVRCGAPPNFEGKTCLGGNTHCYFVVINNGSALWQPARLKSWEPPHCRPGGYVSERPQRQQPPSARRHRDLEREVVDAFVAVLGHDEGVAEE